MTIDLALIHYPVLNKRQEVIGSSVTNLDIHDMARAGKTYGVNTFYLVTPFGDQQRLVAEIVDHWRYGHGSRYNTDRREALALVKVCGCLQDLYEDYAKQGLPRPFTLATSAKELAKEKVTYPDLRQRLLRGEHCLLLFGTGWGLAPEVMREIDAFLPPIGGGVAYNHLSVRSACAIVLDRLRGEESCRMVRCDC